MESLMQLQVITPDRVMCDEPVKMVELRTAEGEIGVLPGHIPLTVMMLPGVMHLTRPDGTVAHMAIHDGFVEIQPDQVTLLVEIAEWPADIDLKRAKAALERANQRINDPSQDIDIARARRAWARATTRIELVTRQW